LVVYKTTSRRSLVGILGRQFGMIEHERDELVVVCSLAGRRRRVVRDRRRAVPKDVLDQPLALVARSGEQTEQLRANGLIERRGRRREFLARSEEGPRVIIYRR
jgi:hypothetical protein